MKISFCFTIATAAFLMYPYASAQEAPVRWTAEVRVRGEMDGRDFKHASPPNYYSLLRMRLGADIRPLENVRLFVQIQDSRAMGEETAGGRFSTLANTKNLDLHQGFLELSRFLFDELSLQAGRMELAYGSERIIGAVGWSNVGRSFDGVRVLTLFPEAAVDVFLMNTGESQVAPGAATPAAVQSMPDTGQTLVGAYVKLRSSKTYSIDLYGLYESNHAQRVAGQNDLSRFTLGTCITGTMENLMLTGEAAWQFGDASTSAIQAYLLSLFSGYSIGASGVSSVGAGVDFLSGTPEGETQLRTFDPVFHTGHKFYGFMDYFIGIPANTRNRGIRDILARVVAKPSPTVDISLWGHLFSLAETWNGSRDLGGELDLVATVKYNMAANLEMGFSAFVPGDVTRQWYDGSDVAFWGYLGVSVRL